MGKIKALLSGVSTYPVNEYLPLPLCVNDVKAVKQALITGLNVAETDIKICGSNGFVTKKDILDGFDSIGSILNADDTLIFYFSGHGEEDKALKIQRKVFCEEEKELSKEDYERLLQEAQRRGNTRLYLLMQTLASTGIRVSELRYITVEAVRKGRADIQCKGKNRVILRQHRTIVECTSCLPFYSQICCENLEIRQDSCDFPNKSGSKNPAQSAHPYCAVLP